jgi:hypothetical protein
MLKSSVRGTRKVMSVLEREKDRIINQIAEDVFATAKSNTPLDKGQARDGWRRENVTHGVNIVNRVPYIDLLEKGRSKQSPRGILGPTTRKISKRRYK